MGHEPGFRRPAVVASHDDMNRHGVPVVLPVTRSRRGYPTHVELEGVLPVVSYVQCELIRAVAAERLVRRVGAVDIAHLTKIDTILRRILQL
jgi:mRNA interferase MazF